MADGKILNSGLQYVPQIAVQYIYLDFDGELTSYNGEILSLENVEVQNSSLTEERIQNILAELNARYAGQNIVFVTQRPTVAGYSTIFIGKTAAFDRYGNFAGLAETIDENNINKTDNAFVMLDSTATDPKIIATIAHETDHLLGTLNHGGEGLQAYAWDIRYDVSSGITSSGITLYCDSMYVSSGGTATATTVDCWGYLYVCSGGTATFTTVNTGGYFYVSSGGTATEVRENGGYVYVADGANVTFVPNTISGLVLSTVATLHSGGTATSTTVNDYGHLYVSGGTATATTVNGGWLFVSTGGTATSTTVNGGGYIFINGNGIVEDLTLKAGGNLGGFAFSEDKYFAQINGSVQIASHVSIIDNRMIISSGGTATATTVNGGGAMHVSTGGTATSTTVDGGDLCVYDGGTATATTVNSGGSLYVSSGGTATATTVNDLGRLYVYDGGTATDITVAMGHGGDSVVVYSGGVVHNATVCSGGDFVLRGGVVNDIVLSSAISNNDRTDLYISSGGEANNVRVEKYAWISLASGKVNNVTINSGGFMEISSGGMATSTTVNYGGSMYVFSGGTATFATVNSGGALYISAGGTASVVFNPWEKGSITSAAGANLSYIYSGVWYGNSTTGLLSTYSSVSNLEVTSGNSALVYAGGIMNSAVVNAGGYLTVSSGGTAASTTVADGGTLTISSGGTAASTIVADGGTLTISSGGTAASATVADGGTLTISSGGTASVVFDPWGGSVTSAAGANLSYIYSGVWYGNSAAGLLGNYSSVSNLEVTSGNSALVYAGGIMNSAVVNSGGTLYVSSGGTASVVFNPWGGSITSAAGADLSYIYSGHIYYGNNESGVLTTYDSAAKFEIASGNTAFICSSGRISNAVVSNGGMLYNSGGVVEELAAYAGAVVSGNGGGVFEVTSNTVVASGVAEQMQDQQYTSTRIFSGFSNFVAGSGLHWRVGTPIQFKETYVREGGRMSFDSGASATKIDNAGTVDIGNNANLRSMTNTGVVNISRGGMLVLNTNAASGVENVWNGGSSWRTVNLGTQRVFADGIADSTTIYKGGDQQIFSNGQAISAFVSSGGSQTLSGGVANSAFVLAGGWQHVSSGGYALETLVDRGYQHVYSDGKVFNTEVSHGSQYISSGGFASATEVYGTFQTFSSAIVSRFDYAADYVYWYNSGGSRHMIHDGWVDYSSTVETVYWFGYNGSQAILEGGLAHDTVLSSGAIQTVDFGGSASKTVVGKDAFQYVLAGGEVFDTQVNSGGILVVEYDGYGENITVSSGGAVGIHGVVRDLTIDRDADYYFHMGEAVFQGYLNCYLTQKSLEALQEILPFSNDLEELYLQVDDSTLREGVYKLADNVGYGFSTTVSIGSDTLLSVNGDAQIVGDRRYSLDLTNGDLYITIEKHVVTPPEGSINGVYWADAQGAKTYVAYSTDNFDTALKVQMPTGSLDTFGLPAGEWQWRVSNDNGSSWQDGTAFQSQNQPGTSQEFRPVTNGHNDLFFAAADGIWNAQYCAQHLGTEFWNGTGEQVLLEGKNKIADIFEGSRDANILVLTDDANGDALFVDDIYTALGDHARFSQIDEIRAGAGDDIVDMTSQRYAYDGSEIEIHGGDGNDTLWGGAETNILLGDGGNDRLVGASGNDILAGGSGNDSMHGGGGEDIFTFGGAFGQDTVEQLSGGSVTLWFETGSESNWNADTMTYTEGVNSVTVTGVSSVTLRFGNNAALPAGAFAEAASEKIFEDKDSGMLA